MRILSCSGSTAPINPTAGTIPPPRVRAKSGETIDQIIAKLKNKPETDLTKLENVSRVLNELIQSGQMDNNCAVKIINSVFDGNDLKDVQALFPENLTQTEQNKLLQAAFPQTNSTDADAIAKSLGFTDAAHLESAIEDAARTAPGDKEQNVNNIRANLAKYAEQFISLASALGKDNFNKLVLPQ
jgi:hypothetical protein